MEMFFIYAFMGLIIVTVFGAITLTQYLIERAVTRRHLAYLKGMRLALDRATANPNGFSRRIK